MRKVKIGGIINLTISALCFLLFTGFLCYLFSYDTVTIIKTLEVFGIKNLTGTFIAFTFLGLFSALCLTVVGISIALLACLNEVKCDEDLNKLSTFIKTYSIICYVISFSSMFLVLIGSILAHASLNSTINKKEEDLLHKPTNTTLTQDTNAEDKVSRLKRRLNKLEQMRIDGLITEEQYKQARLKMIQKSLE